MTQQNPVQTAIRQTAFILFLICCCLAVVYGIWRWNSEASTTEQKLEAPAPSREFIHALPLIPLVNITNEAGITFVHENGARGDKLLPETMGGGCAFFDMDNDGDQDLLLINSSVWPENRSDSLSSENRSQTSELYENDGKGNFRNVTAGSGFDVACYGMGCACGDFDADGLTDIYITCVGPNQLMRNRGGGKFEDVTEQLGAAGKASDWGTSCGWFDYDSDGDLDLFVCNYLDWSREKDLAQDFRLAETRSYGRPQAFGGTFLTLFKNHEGTRLEDVSHRAGLAGIVSPTGQPIAKALGLSFYDFDKDGDLDVLIANDTVPNFLLENLGDGTFREIGTAVGIAYDTEGNARGAMGIDVTSFRNATAIGVAIGNFSNEMTALYVTPNDECFFIDEAVSNGLGPLTRLQLTFGLVFADLDLDGRADLITANGHLEEEIHRVLPSQTYQQSPQLFWNAGPESPTEFVPLSAEQAGASFFQPIVGRGCAVADIDNDGDIDLLITSLHGPPKLYRNDQKSDHHWLRLKIQGKAGNREAIGAMVRVETESDVQEKLVMPTRGYLSQSELAVHFGLGSAKEVQKIRVTWPDKDRTEILNVQPDVELEIKYPSDNPFLPK